MKRVLWVLSLFLFIPLFSARPALAAELDMGEPGVVDVPAAVSNTAEAAAWTPVEDARGSSRFAAALDAWLLAHAHGPQASRALIEKAALQENLIEAGAYLRRAQGEAQGTPWGAKASLELAKLEYEQERTESANTILEGAETWQRSEELEPDWLYWRGQCRLVLNGLERAKDDFERLIAGYPKHSRVPEARLGLADCDAALALKKGDKAQADKAMAGFELLYKDPQCPVGAQALWGAASLRQHQGALAEAKRLFLRVRSQYPASFEATGVQDRLAELAKAPVPTPVPVTAPSKSGRLHVQVGAFSKRAGAVNLQRILKKRHYPVLLLQVHKQGRTLYIVKVGPYKNHADAEGAAHKLETRDKVPTRITED